MNNYYLIYKYSENSNITISTNDIKKLYPFVNKRDFKLFNSEYNSDIAQIITRDQAIIIKLNDVSASAQDPEVPSRFMPCMASGLAYYIALKKNPEKATLLKAQYEQDFKLASEEDRNRASVMLTPTRSNF